MIGYRNAGVYTSRLREMNIEFETIDDQLQTRLDISVMKVMEGRDSPEDHTLIMEIISTLRNKQVDGIIPGCTEIPLLLKESLQDIDIINPAQLLAEAAIHYALARN